MHPKVVGGRQFIRQIPANVLLMVKAPTNNNAAPKDGVAGLTHAIAYAGAASLRRVLAKRPESSRRSSSSPWARPDGHQRSSGPRHVHHVTADAAARVHPGGEALQALQQRAQGC